MPSLEDVRERIAAVEAEIRAREKIPLSGRTIIACHTLPYVCNLVAAGPESPLLEVEIQPGDTITMPQALHSPTALDKPAETWAALSDGTPKPAESGLLAQQGSETPSRGSGSSQASSFAAAPLRVFSATQPKHSSGTFTPSRPPSPTPSQQYFPPISLAKTVPHRDDMPAKLLTSPAPHRWVLQPRRGHAALNAGIRSLADRRVVLIAWPGDLRNSRGEHIESKSLNDEQKHSLEEGLTRLAHGNGSDGHTGIECKPVWLDDREASLHYEGFCKGSVLIVRCSWRYRSLCSVHKATSGRCSITCPCRNIRTRRPKARPGRRTSRSTTPLPSASRQRTRKATWCGSKTTSETAHSCAATGSDP